jgi:hypothetical protein
MAEGWVAPHGTETVRLGRPPTDDRSWWDAYETVLQQSGIGSVSRGVIHDDAEYILTHGVLGREVTQADRWSASRERRGAVMGAVQSGKTASMMALTALALDRGIDAVVILAGTRTALWLQTWERVLAQLDTLPQRALRRVLLPGRPPSSVEEGVTSLATLYNVTPQLAKRAVHRRRPIIAVVMKQVAHLEQLGRTLHDAVYPEAADRESPFHLLVIDDEADDSSVVDAPNGHQLIEERQVPRRIIDLWESRRAPGQTAGANLYATYVAYTATPQANFLQDEGNPLAPTDFVVSLRTPGPDGDPSVRTPTYRVPEGSRGWYTGGEVYYKRLAPVPLCEPTDGVDEAALLVHATRGFLVASAIRMQRQPAALGPAAARAASFATRSEAKKALITPMSMLVHPSFSKSDHFRTAGTLLAWAAGRDPADGALLLAQGERQLSVVGIHADMDRHPEKWEEWLKSYQHSAAACQELLGMGERKFVPPSSEWPQLRSCILDELLPGVTVAVVNSDEEADDRPEFDPVEVDGSWRAPRDLATIFVSGNVMSRGLTLEGLTMTLFTRSSDDPAADTQMQMQRWFGYRGGYIDLCRVLMSERQISLFTRYHEADEALRRDVLAAMRSSEVPTPSVLQGHDFKATGKVSGLRGAMVWPGPAPFMRYMNDAEEDHENQVIVAELFSAPVAGVPDESARQGLLLDRTLSLVEAADVLDDLRFKYHNGREDERVVARWRSLENHAGLRPDDPYWPLFRGPDTEGGVDLGGSSPYAVAAYLRFWAVCLERRVPGVVSTDEPPVLWSLVDLQKRGEQQPRFRVGLRFGSGPQVETGPLAKLAPPVHPMTRSVLEGGFLKGTWGSHNVRSGEAWGDEFFDHYRAGQLPPLTASRARAAGSDGLILFHVIDRDPGVSIALGVHLPVGGPDQVHAVTRGH